MAGDEIREIVREELDRLAIEQLRADLDGVKNEVEKLKRQPRPRRPGGSFRDVVCRYQAPIA